MYLIIVYDVHLLVVWDLIRSPQDPTVRRSVAQTVDGKIKVRAPGMLHLEPHLVVATLRAHRLCFWQLELAELADGPTGCGEVARDGCSFAWNFSATRSTCAY
jgi:hypothetical protein